MRSVRNLVAMPRVLAILIACLTLVAVPVADGAKKGNPRNDRDQRVTGTTRSDTLKGGRGDDVLRGRGGNDRLSGGSGDDLIAGDSGNDRISGGSGDDTLLGGAGRDRINGGSGKDTISGGNGNDIISAADGFVDEITCGAGRDRVTADREDSVDRDCERVKRK